MIDRRHFCLAAAAGVAATAAGDPPDDGAAKRSDDLPSPPLPKDDERAVRRKSLEALGEAGFRVAGNLPLWSEWTGEPLRLRPAEEIAGRLMSFFATTLYLQAESLPESDLTGWLDSAGLRAGLTEKERDAFSMDRGAAVEKYANLDGWRQENLWAAAWVLGFDRRPGLRDGFIDGRVVGEMRKSALPKTGTGISDYLKEHRPRPLAEVASLHDLFYCAHNAVRSAQQGRDTVPEGFDPTRDGGVVHEKRHALTWCLSPGVAWDATDLAT